MANISNNRWYVFVTFIIKIITTIVGFKRLCNLNCTYIKLNKFKIAVKSNFDSLDLVINGRWCPIIGNLMTRESIRK